MVTKTLYNYPTHYYLINKHSFHLCGGPNNYFPNIFEVGAPQSQQVSKIYALTSPFGNSKFGVVNDNLLLI